MQQSLTGLAHYGANLQNAYRSTSSEATASVVRAQMFRASLVGNPFGEPIKLEAAERVSQTPTK